VGEALGGQGQGCEERSRSRDSARSRSPGLRRLGVGVPGGSRCGYPQEEDAASKVCSTVISFDPESD
jgi:hypothetical protein